MKVGGNPNNFSQGPTGGGASFNGGFPARATNSQTQAEELFRNIFGGMGGGFSFGGNNFEGGNDSFFGMGGNGRFRGRGRRPGGHPQNGGFDGPSSFFREKKIPPLVVEVPCSLEQLNGCVTCKLKVRRNINGREDEKILHLELKRWWKDGTKVTFDGEGDQKPGFKPQDVQFIIKEAKHNVYTRKGDDLICNANISLKQALSGLVINRPGIDGSNVHLEVNDVVKPNEESRVRNAEMKNKRGGRGDVIFKFNIEFPSYLSSEQKSQAKRFLPD